MDYNTYGILTQYYSHAEAFGSADTSQDIATLTTILPDAEVMATVLKHYENQIRRFEYDQRERMLVGTHSSMTSEWEIKYPAAVAELAGTATEDQRDILRVEASLTGESLTALAQLIVMDREAFKAIGLRLTGLRRKALGQIRQAQTVDAIASVYVAEIQTMSQVCDAMAAQIGVD